MYSVPVEFEEMLEREFQGRLRIRWSFRENAWHIEQKMRRGMVIPLKVERERDDLIRAKDGYGYVLSVQPGTKMACPKCGLDLTVPAMRFEMVICEHCKMKGYEYRHAVGYWPLSESLIDHLKKIDPERGASQRLRDQVERHNLAKTKSQQNDVWNKTDAALRDDFSKIAGIPTTGLSGATKMWINAPESLTEAQRLEK